MQLDTRSSVPPSIIYQNPYWTDRFSDQAAEVEATTTRPIQIHAGRRMVLGSHGVKIVGVRGASGIWSGYAGSSEEVERDISVRSPAAWMKSCVERLNLISSYRDGWLGNDSKAAAREALSDTRAFLVQLDHARVMTGPFVGLDEDGCIVLSWQGAHLCGSLSIEGDGKYSFYVERGGKSAMVDDALLSRPLDRALLEILRG